MGILTLDDLNGTELDSLKEEAIRKTLEYVDLGVWAYNITPFEPEIEFVHTGRMAGKAWLRQRRIEYNLELLHAAKSDFIRCTVPHAVAHLIAYIKFNDHGHGRGWRRVMQAFGQGDQHRCHSYDTSTVSSARRRRR